MAPALGSRSTATEALRGADLSGKTAVVTGDRPLCPCSSKSAGRPSVSAFTMLVGANSGLGVETARALAHAGCRVIITSRKVDAGQKVADELNSAGLKVSFSRILQQTDM